MALSQYGYPIGKSSTTGILRFAQGNLDPSGKPSVFCDIVAMSKRRSAARISWKPMILMIRMMERILPATNNFFRPFQPTADCGFSHRIFHGFSRPQRRKPPLNCGECHCIKFDLEFGERNITILAYNLSQKMLLKISNLTHFCWQNHGFQALQSSLQNLLVQRGTLQRHHWELFADVCTGERGRGRP